MKLYTYRGNTGWYSFSVVASHADEARDLIRAAAFAKWLAEYVERHWPDRDAYIVRFTELWPDDPAALANLEEVGPGEAVAHYNDE